MGRVELEHERHVRHRLAGGSQDALQVGAHAVLGGHEAGGRLGEPVRDPHVGRLRAERLPHPLDDRLQLVLGCLLLIGIGLAAGEPAEVEIALRHGLQRLAVERVEVRDDPLVDPVVEQQDLDALLAEDFQVGALLRGREAAGGDVVDLLLPVLHARDVVGERDGLVARVAVRRREAEQPRNPLAVGLILADPFLDDAAELAPEVGVPVRLLLRQFLEQPQDALDRRVANGLHVARLLEDLARDVERQVVRVDQAPDEAQVARHELLRAVHDEHAPDVELDAVAPLAVPDVERRAARHVEQHRVLLASLDPGVHVRERRLEVVRDVLVELVVLPAGDLRLRPGPEGGRLVHLLGGLDVPGVHLLAGNLFLPHQDGERDVVGVLAQDGAEARPRQQLVLAAAQVQRDLGAARRLRDPLDGVLALAPALPADGVTGRQPGPPRGQGDAVGHDERRVEAHAELADEPGVLRLVAGELLDELARARLGDGPDVGDHLLVRHPDAVVGDRDGAGLGVELDAEGQLRVVVEQGGVGEGLEAQLVAGIRGVRDQLAQEDLLVRVQGVDHQVEQLSGLGLELMGGSGRRL